MITGRDGDRIEKVVEDCRRLDPTIKCIGIRAELTVDEDIHQLVEKTVQEFGRIDILVINAGLLRATTIDSPDYITVFDEVFTLKVRSVQVLTKLVVPYLVKTQGNFINVSGIHSVQPVSLQFN